MSEPYEQEVILNGAVTIISHTFTDLLSLTLEGPDGFYRAGIGEMSLENAEYQLLHNGVVIDESLVDEIGITSDEYFEMKKGDKLVLRVRYDGEGPHGRAVAHRATLFAEEDLP